MIKVSYNDLLTEATREAVEIDMPDGSSIVVDFPNGDQSKALKIALESGDEDAALLALFGDEHGKVLIHRFKDEPADLPARLISAVSKAFGIPPNLPSSSS